MCTLLLSQHGLPSLVEVARYAHAVQQAGDEELRIRALVTSIAQSLFLA